MMTPQEQEFVTYWSEHRKRWSWKTHSIETFLNIVVPVAVLIDLVNYFIIGDTEYVFFSFLHFFMFLRNLIGLSILIIMGTGIIDWGYNEKRYWGILRKNKNKLQ